MLASLGNALTYDLIVPVVVDIERIDIIEQVFENYRPEIIFHANVRKYPSFLSKDLEDLNKTNYLRTLNLAKMASKYNTGIFVLVSSLAASQNKNPVANSLRIEEASLEQHFTNTNTRLIIPRICDIIENRGGIVSLIESQVRENQALILPSIIDVQTDLISKYGATEFILQTIVEASRIDSKNRIFNCKPSFTGTVCEIADKIAKLYGLKLEADIPITYSDQL